MSERERGAGESNRAVDMNYDYMMRDKVSLEMDSGNLGDGPGACWRPYSPQNSYLSFYHSSDLAGY